CGPERLPVGEIFGRLVERGLRPAERTCGDVDPATVEAVHRDAEAGAFAVLPAQHRIGRHPTALEDNLRRRLPVPAHLLFLTTETQPRSFPFDDERRYSAWTLTAGARHHHVDIRGAGAGNELFDAVEHIVATLLDGARAQRAGIRAGARLRQAVAG